MFAGPSRERLSRQAGWWSGFLHGPVSVDLVGMGAGTE
jgi:hypothetical protein